MVTAPDPKRGEQLVLVTEQRDASRAALAAAAREAACPEIFVPRAIVSVPAVPILGSGKIDYPAVARLAGEFSHAS